MVFSSAPLLSAPCTDVPLEKIRRGLCTECCAAGVVAVAAAAAAVVGGGSGGVESLVTPLTLKAPSLCSRLWRILSKAPPPALLRLVAWSNLLRSAVDKGTRLPCNQAAPSVRRSNPARDVEAKSRKGRVFNPNPNRNPNPKQSRKGRVFHKSHEMGVMAWA